MAQYDSPEAVVQQVQASFQNTNLTNAVNSLLTSIGPDASFESASTAADATSSKADVLFMNFAEGERGTTDAPIVFDDSGRDEGRAYFFEGDEGVVARFNTVERVIVGTNGDDNFTVEGDRNTTVDGGAGNDTITASGGDDSITGGAGDDSISAGAGNDSIYGGAGADEAVFAGNAADYTIEQNGGLITVTHNETGEVNEVVNVETLTFDDGSQAVEVSSNVQALTTLYKQLFSFNDAREQNGAGQADLEGLQYWNDRAEEGTSLGQIALSMLNSDEAGNKLDALDLGSAEGISAVIELLYTDVLGRAANDIDTEGRDYWINQVTEEGVSLEVVADAFVASEELQEQNVQASDWDFLI
jgi:Ca2+-binding RTX toxin-like protein